jgi:hypothetical protein
MMFEISFDRGSYLHRLQRITQEIAHHPDRSGIGDLHQHRDIGHVLAQRGVRGVRGVPHALPAEDAAPRLDLGPVGIEGVAGIAYPLRWKTL